MKWRGRRVPQDRGSSDSGCRCRCSCGSSRDDCPPERLSAHCSGRVGFLSAGRACVSVFGKRCSMLRACRRHNFFGRKKEVSSQPHSTDREAWASPLSIGGTFAGDHAHGGFLLVTGSKARRISTPLEPRSNPARRTPLKGLELQPEHGISDRRFPTHHSISLTSFRVSPVRASN